MTVRVRRTLSSEGGEKVAGQRKWWQKLVNRKGKEKTVSTPKQGSFAPPLSESGMYIYNRSNPLYENSVASRASVMSMIKDWAKISRQASASPSPSPRKQIPAAAAPGHKGKSNGAHTPRTPGKSPRRSHSPLAGGLPRRDACVTPRSKNGQIPLAGELPRRDTCVTPRSKGGGGAYAAASFLVSPFDTKGQHFAKNCDDQNGDAIPFAWPQFTPPHEAFGGGLIQSKSVPMALGDMFLEPESFRDSGHKSGQRRVNNASGQNPKTAGCKEPKRRGKQGICSGLAPSVGSHTKSQSNGSSAIGCPSTYFGSSNPSESSAVCSDDTDEQKNSVAYGKSKRDSLFSDESDAHEDSEQIRTVRRVGGRDGDSVRFVDTVRSSCEDDLHMKSLADKKPKSRRLLSKLSFKKELDNRDLASRLSGSKSGRQTPEARSPRNLSTWKKSNSQSGTCAVKHGMTWNVGSPSTSAYAKRQEVLGKIMEKRLHDLGNLEQTPGRFTNQIAQTRSDQKDPGQVSIVRNRRMEVHQKNERIRLKK